ncbi:hypothetical protein [Piscirickettsia litoralis]|uniref:Uncharacterized protein n=1 Tax=Piscirickettsia litoralis TaxID=1891921 RepID=A0ABX3A557_9GAMM|nr:hypothetical protein [Piscirickettsia litoralis]ODN42565.1 hypothetical protein BGC07_06010 [Piscirickettsia litoralis]
MAFDVQQFKELHGSLHQPGAATTGIDESIEQLNNADIQAVAEFSQTQEKRPVFADPLAACQYHAQKVQDAVAMDKQALFLSPEDLNDKTASQIAELSDRSQQQLLEYHKIQNRAPQAYHLQELKSSLVNLYDKHQVPGDTNGESFDQLQESVNQINNTLKIANGNIPSKAALATAGVATVGAVTWLGYSGHHASEIVNSDAKPSDQSPFDWETSENSLQESMSRFFEEGNASVVAYGSKAKDKTAGGGWLGYSQGTSTLNENELRDALDQHVGQMQQQLSAVGANQSAVQQNTQNLLMMQSMINNWGDKPPSLDQIPPQQLEQLNGVVDNQYQQLINNYQSYNPYPQAKIDEINDQLDENNSIVKLSSQVDQANIQAEAWQQCSTCADFSAADVGAMAGYADTFNQLAGGLSSIGYNGFDALANKVSDYQDILGGAQLGLLGAYSSQKDALLQQALGVTGQLSDIQGALSAFNSQMSLADKMALVDSLALSLSNLDMTQAALQNQLEAMVVSTALTEASEALKNNIEMDVCGLALPPLFNVDFSMPSLSLGLPSINLLKLTELAKLLEGLLPSMPSFPSTNFNLIENILKKIKDMLDKVTSCAGSAAGGIF